ncbi:hypothetical protein RM550_26270 [Streptomyces sp. DSM 41527]|uniref:Helix-turn-helix domain-containing protein n=1 Tax=Streptomyces mooreae TaxID=3075523 RepID=A0ABU2TE50_9ACTN|nr:hypothetical protein [Streptomyces sp. DSM 41527]MDT0459181.1 hypothetical protein [Streptomyces sp. DSM 41527]
MSEIATELVWSRSQACRGSFLVMLALARMADDQGKATATLEEISRQTRLTARSITKCLGELTSLGEISHQRGGGASNPNSYSILLQEDQGAPENSETELPTITPTESKDGASFQEVASHNAPEPLASGKFQPAESEVSSSRTQGGNTPYGSITTSQKQASVTGQRGKNHNPLQGPVTVPETAKELVSAMSGAGMLVGWRLTDAEWDRVKALVSRWGHERLVEMVAGRWNADRPPQTARYLLRIWADLPAEGPAATAPGNVVPMRRKPGTHAPFQNTANTSAYQNGF